MGTFTPYQPITNGFASASITAASQSIAEVINNTAAYRQAQYALVQFLAGSGGHADENEICSVRTDGQAATIGVTGQGFVYSDRDYLFLRSKDEIDNLRFITAEGGIVTGKIVVQLYKGFLVQS